MSRRIPTPKIDCRTASDLLLQLREMVPHYTREWPAIDEDDPGVGLLKIFSFIAEGVISRLNRAPERNFLAFLDMLGIRLLPATPAHAPVRFLVASGTENKFLIPKNTQVSAPPLGDRSEELPFETIKELLAIPAALTALVAVDPEKDRIYKPPPSFLALMQAASDAPALTLKAFSAAGSKSLQLDPPGQVQEGDFLRIEAQAGQPGAGAGCAPLANPDEGRAGEYLVVSEVKGPLVLLTERLVNNYAENTQVHKLTKFELFEGKNFQEHVLYLAHSEYFDLKSEAQIELVVEHAQGTATNLQPLNIIWEFFGELSKEEGWHAFEMGADNTLGLSRDGEVELKIPAATPPDKAEIKETEIRGNKSRWIRARLAEPISETTAQRLPQLDSIMLKVSRKRPPEPAIDKAQELPADQAFHNDTPLDVNLAFNPFGPEPRPLDRFYIASAEAFSKLGAKVTLDVDLSPSDLLSSPAAIIDLNGKIRAFAQGVAGRLWEFQIDPSNPNKIIEPINHQPPMGVRLNPRSVPAVVEDSGRGRIGLFVKVSDGRIYLRVVQTNPPSQWVLLDPQPPSGKLTFDPAAVLLGDGKWEVFVVVDGIVYSKIVDPNNLSAKDTWNSLDNKFVANSTPFAIPPSSNNPNKLRLIVTDKEGLTQLLGSTGWNVKTPTNEKNEYINEYIAADKARPFGFFEDKAGTSVLRIYLRNKDNELVSFDTEGDGKDLGQPSNAVKLDSNPYVVNTDAGTRVYVKGSNQQLWENNPKAEKWRPQPNPIEFTLREDPVAVALASMGGESPVEGFVFVLSTSDKNTLLALRPGEGEVHHNKLQAGPRELILLEDPLDAGKTYFVRITSGPGSTSTEEAVRKIISDPNKFKLAVLEDSLGEITTDQTEYELFTLIEGDGVSKKEGSMQITLKADTKAEIGDFVFARGQLREIESFDNTTPSLANLKTAWVKIPNKDDHYDILRLEQKTKKARPGCDLRAVLARNASNVEDFYADLLIKIIPDQVGNPPRQIVSYDAETKSIVLKEAFAVTPAKDSDYEIKVGLWISHSLPSLAELRPELSWEYWNGSGWVALRGVDDKTNNFLFKGLVTFNLPEDIAPTEVAGQKNFWIRARLVGGDYGREQFVKVDENKDDLILSKDAIRPPLIDKLTIFYEVTEEKEPQFILTFNNLDYLDQTAANTTPNKHYRPYLALLDKQKALYFGFDKEFEGGPVRLYFAAKELVVDERNKPKLRWEFASDNKWKAIVAGDETDAFIKPEFVTWTVPVGFQRRQHFGEALFWIRATLEERAKSWKESPLLAGIFLNTVETIQARTVLNEILGSGVGTKNERFHFQQLPVLEGEEVRVREVLTDEERKQLILAEGQDTVLEVLDQQGRVLETWVRWREVIEFFDAEPGSRRYRLDRAGGELEFGDGVRGRILPSGGDNIRAFSYQAGGGAKGNMAAGEINAPVTAVAGVESVVNPVPSGGGSDKATEDEMLEIGPAQVSNRGRAVTPDDFERLAMEASREVRKARCIPNRNKAGQNEIGWISVYLVPDSKEAQPKPSLELRRAVQRYLAERADVTLVKPEQISVSSAPGCAPRRVQLFDNEEHIFIGPPQYVPVNVEVKVYAKSLDVVGTAELKVKERLTEFLHPLSGGPANEGWDFGRDLAASDLYLLLEEIEEVDHIGSLRLFSGETESEDQIVVGPDALLASGDHTVSMLVANGE